MTPDSFSDGGRYLDRDAALKHALDMLQEGADVIDVGGASSRPRGAHYGEGAQQVGADEEVARVVPVVEVLAREFGARVSVDTTRVEVAEACLRAGARVINDVSNGASERLLDAVAAADAELVLMHTRADGAVEPPNTDYRDVVREVRDELLQSMRRARKCGVRSERIWFDPGIGFAKTAEQSLELLARLREFKLEGRRLLVGPSRKGFIADAAPHAGGTKPAPLEREAGTAAAVTVAVLGGADAVRVHDVRAMRQAARVAGRILKAGAA